MLSLDFTYKEEIYFILLYIKEYIFYLKYYIKGLSSYPYKNTNNKALAI